MFRACKNLGLFGGLRADFGRAWGDLVLLGHILYLDPRADLRSVTMRGGPPPSVGNLDPN